jgi:DNA polymerase epsilon subunit 1
MRGASPASGLESMGAVHSGASGNSSSSDAQAGASTAAAMEGEYIGRSMVHLDAFCWVQRDSYLPQGNQGLKAVTKSKLGYDPVEVDAEDMVRLARENPHRMASYSVSDAVATFYLYTTYVHNFIFSLSTIIPMGSEDVLRKGSGTLCEALLMVEAHRCNIICPNKQVDELETFYNGHLLESETYIGGHVECLEAGVFRSDIATDFKLIPSALQSLIDRVDRDMTFALEVEHGLQRSDALNYDAVKQDIVQALEMLRDSPIRSEPPKIYHLDVGAMYPNIILTNRLQPSAIVSDSECASCEFNLEENACKRRMVWSWRGDFSPASMAEYRSVQRQLAYEKPASGVAFSDLSEKEQARQARARLKAYAQKAYQKTKVTVTEERVDTVCMRENSFYVDTVRAFRDRRYDYKLLTKTWKNKKVEAERKGDVVGKKNAEDKEVLMDSLQLAHKCILNSFYGYVMRKGARWRSMQMAGIVTHTGAQLIMQARELVEQVGRPLELDTDGIWCILPSSFPQDFKFVMRDGSKVGLQYPCAMLNADVAERYTNHQYQDLIAGTKRYAVRSECSIFFELDGPYKAMVLPASPEEGKLLKKKYAVFNFDGSLAELKGFELKRRGELELVKIFQSQVFEHFLEGSTLQECYDAVGAVGNQWLDVLDSEGANMDDAELLELISERKTISKTVDDYEGRKATSLTTAFRLADFLGAEMVKDKGLNCNLIISKYPTGAPVTDRAIPVAIFSADEAVRKHYLRKWLKDPKLVCEDFREVVDWEYYKDRLGKSIQKIVSIPAGLQKIPNPCPRIDHPVWLHRRLEDAKSVFKQQSISHMFQKLAAKTPNASLVVYKQQKSPPKSNDIEDIGTTANPQALVVAKSVEVNKTDLTGSFSMYHDPPATSDKFQKWLDDRKVEWAEGRRQKRISRSSDGSGGPILKRGAGIGDMIRNAAITAEKAIWQILEIQETDSPGLFLVWAMVGKNQLQRYYVEIPRVLYVNCAGDDASRMAVSIGGKPVKKDLPHGKPCLNLYEISISEQKFVRNDKVLGLFLCDPQIEGVYGSKLPLLFRGILRLGCMTRLLRSDRGTGSASKPIRLADLQMAIKTPHMYLEASSAVFRKIFIYISPDNLRPDAQGIVGIFIMDALNDIDVGAEGPTKHNARAFVFIAQAASMGAKPPMNSIYSKLCPGQQSGCKFSTAIVPSMYDALSKCNERLSQYLQERRGPTLVVVQAPMTARQCRKSMSLLTEFPLVMMPVNTKDGDFPALLWQNRIARIMIQRFLFFPSWFHDRVKSARFAQIPIGNLGSDAVISIIDTLFARHFEHNRHVLWGSNESLPDLGGSELDDVNLWAEPIRIPQLSEAGVYRSICVELEIFGLAVASIMSPGSLEAFGSAGAQANERSNSTMDGGNVVASSVSSDVSCLRAFMLLKALVSKWIHNVGTLRDQYCDAVLVSLYRFLCGHNGNALMNDPALHRIVFDMMGRMFTKFVGELKKLGVSVVYTDFHKVIIHTQKRDIGAAAEYLNFIVSSITSKETFRFLQLNTKRVWRQLIWLSASNFAGIPIALGGDDELEAEDNASPIELSPNWEASGVAPPNQTSANSSPIVVPDNDAQESDGDYDDDFGRNVGTSSEYDFLDDFEPDVEPDRSSRQESSLNMTSSEQRKTNSQRSAPESSHQNDAADSARSNLVGQWAIADFLSPSARIFMMRIIGTTKSIRLLCRFVLIHFLRRY